MTEKYLHYLWESKSFPIINYPLSDGEELSILDYGEYNQNNSGPDFKFGCIQIGNVKMHGHIEIHIKSSDWYRHKHDLDQNYNNVILHVVYENDVKVIQGGYELPFLELKHLIQEDGYQQYLRQEVFRKVFPCQKLIEDLDEVYLKSMVIRSLEDKMQSKMKELQRFAFETFDEKLYLLLAQSFGTGINKEPFEDLVRNLSWSDLNKLPSSSKKALIISVSGVLQQKTSQTENGQVIWNYKGTRPKNFPSIRIRQFSELIANFDIRLFNELNSESSIKTKFYNEINRIWNKNNLTSPRPSRAFVNLILINAIVPYYWCIGEENENKSYQELALDLLYSIPAEQNSIINKWKSIGVVSKNAFDSQGLLALYRYYCCHKKCLSCSVGEKLINQKP